MKRIFIIFACMLTISVYAQKVSLDRIESDGKHQIMTSSKDFSIEGAKYSFCMKVFEGFYTTDWCLLISSYNYISDHAEVLLKLGNGELMYLPCNNVNKGKVSTPGYGIPIGTITYITPSKEVDYYSSLYALSTEQIDKIAMYGIRKIRISTGTAYRDKEFPGNSLGKFLVKCCKKIQERLDNPQKKKSLYDDF